MCRLFCRIANAMEAIEQNFEQHVITQGTILHEQAEDAARDKKRGRKDIASLQQEAIVSIVIELHALHAKYLQYVSGYFMNHYAFHKALRQSFELICNKELAGSKHAKSVVTFFDNILKKGGSENLCHEDIENTLEKVDDLKLARESQTNFEVYLNDNANISLGIDLTVTILTTSFWPSYKSFELNLPLEMAKCVDSFKDFYQTKTKHRKLKWIYSSGKCNVIGMFDAKPIELIVTPCQAAALLLFNASEKLSYLDIKSQLNLIDEDIVRLLHSLACAKYKILNKTPDTKVFAPTDYFEFNTTFTDRKGRIKIPLSPLDDRKKVNEDVDKKRHNAIDASIVRIMKRRKILPYQQLVNKCVEQLAHMFKPDFQAIKRQIEDLIGNE